MIGRQGDYMVGSGVGHLVAVEFRPADDELHLEGLVPAEHFQDGPFGSGGHGMNHALAVVAGAFMRLEQADRIELFELSHVYFPM